MAHERREVWAKRVERWRDSGLTLKEFATEIGVNANTLAGWRWRLRPRVTEKRSSSGRVATPTFLEIVRPVEGEGRSASAPSAPAAEVTAADAFELELRSGYRVRVPARFDASALRRLVDALEAR